MTIVTTESGQVRGLVVDGLSLFRNIPYAAPPFGERRFRAPVPAAKWDGVRDGTVAGPGAPQPITTETADGGYFNPEAWGEDCLTLEVFTPDTAASLPVMVWIHGGGFLFGVGSATAHSGRTFARDGIVHVAINYRLGVEGFLPLGDGADNLGLRDMVAALEWVQRNIAAFGGDADNVTVFGESGGAVGVMHVLAMPSARGLFQRAIAQSGSPLASVPLAEGEEMTRRMAKRLGVAATRDGFASVPVAKTTDESFAFGTDFVKNPIRNGKAAFLLSPYRAVFGTPSLPAAPIEAAGAGVGVPLLTGTNRNEAYDFARILERGGLASRAIIELARRMMGGGGALARSYLAGPRAVPRGLPLLEAVWTDWSFRIPTLRLVEARQAPTWLYEFRWESPGLPPGLGSIHALEIPFMRDDLAALVASGQRGVDLVGTAPPQALADGMHRAWVSFAKTGDPGWAAYDLAERSTMVFDTTSGVVSDAAGAERRAWAGRRYSAAR
jgi:para-nitrobenzyl esterase